MTNYKIVIEDTAEKDLIEILNYISNTLHEPNVAKKLYLSIKKKIISLSNMPFRYAVIKEEPYHFLKVRKFPVENYTAFYIVDEQENTVHIFRILYNRRDWQHLL